jgi:hypothetical protein
MASKIYVKMRESGLSACELVFFVGRFDQPLLATSFLAKPLVS